MMTANIPARIALALAALLALAAPSIAQAQSDQKIVMRCTFDGYTNQTLDYVVDLAAKTMSLTHTTTGLSQPMVNHYSGRVTEVADAQIVWTYSDTTRTVTDTLNRYSGQIVSQVAMVFLARRFGLGFGHERRLRHYPV